MHKRPLLTYCLVAALAMPVTVLAASDAAAANGREPTIDDIYKAAQAGRFSDADAMIGHVLTSHPDSGKAHYVHAELLAKEGGIAAAKSEYTKATQLSPGLPFAKPEAVAALAQRLDGSLSPNTVAYRADNRLAPAATSFSPGGIGAPAKIGIVLVLLAAGVFMFRRINGRPHGPGAASPGYAAPSYANGATGYGPAGMNPGYAPSQGAPASSGLGGALMTGAAMGLGAVAVEEAVRHFSHQDAPSSGVFDRQDNAPGFGSTLMPDANADMGGNDFGISSAGSWDVGGGDVNDDW